MATSGVCRVPVFTSSCAVSSLTSNSSNYEVTSSDVSSRTKAVACLTYMTLNQWRDYVSGCDEVIDPEKTTSVLRRWIDTYLKECAMKIKILEKMQREQESSSQDEEMGKVGILMKRWNQIKDLCEGALTTISKS